MNHKGFRLFGHPVHPLLVHFPIGLWSISILSDILGIWRANAFWWHFSFWCIGFGLGFGLLAAVTGLIDSMAVPQEGPQEKTLTFHMYAMLTAFALFLGSFLMRTKSPVLSGNHLVLAVSLSVLGFIVLVFGGWYGGELVYRWGIGAKHPEA